MSEPSDDDDDSSPGVQVIIGDITVSAGVPATETSPAAGVGLDSPAPTDAVASDEAPVPQTLPFTVTVTVTRPPVVDDEDDSDS